MKQLLTIALLCLCTAVFANNGGGTTDPTKETKVELVNSVSVKSEVATEIAIDFNLNMGLTAIVQTPTCGSDPGANTTGWTNYGCANPPICDHDVYQRSCTETITIYWPWGAETYTHTRVEAKNVPRNVE